MIEFFLILISVIDIWKDSDSKTTSRNRTCQAKWSCKRWEKNENGSWIFGNYQMKKILKILFKIIILNIFLKEIDEF